MLYHFRDEWDDITIRTRSTQSPQIDPSFNFPSNLHVAETIQILLNPSIHLVDFFHNLNEKSHTLLTRNYHQSQSTNLQTIFSIDDRLYSNEQHLGDLNALENHFINFENIQPPIFQPYARIFLKHEDQSLMDLFENTRVIKELNLGSTTIIQVNCHRLGPRIINKLENCRFLLEIFIPQHGGKTRTLLLKESPPFTIDAFF